MATQNLVSAILTAELKDSIKQLLEQLKSKCSFIVTLTPDELISVFKASDGYLPFLDKAYNTILAYPNLMSLAFNKDEFIKDYTFAKELLEIIAEFNRFMDSLNNTLTAALSDSMVEALDVYSAVKQNKDKIPGLQTDYEEMAKYFKKSRNIKEQPKQ